MKANVYATAYLFSICQVTARETLHMRPERSFSATHHVTVARLMSGYDFLKHCLRSCTDEVENCNLPSTKKPVILGTICRSDVETGGSYSRRAPFSTGSSDTIRQA